MNKNSLASSATLLPDARTLKHLQRVADANENLVIAEIAGRDSIAAMTASAMQEGDLTFLPTIAMTGTEYGDFNAPLNAIDRVAELLPDATILEPLILFDPLLWSALNSRYGAILAANFPGWSPCAACHMYVHLMRAPLALALQCPIISGERDSHDGRYKLSQLPDFIDAAITVMAEAGVSLLEPIRDVYDGSEIEKLVGGADWKEGAQQLECVHSGSFKDARGKFSYDKEVWQSYLTQFLMPAARAILDKMVAGELNVDWIALVGEIALKLPKQL